jgi:hypothetical protein
VKEESLMPKGMLVLFLSLLTVAPSAPSPDRDADPATVISDMKSSDPAVRKSAYDAAMRLGAPMVSPLLDVVGQGEAAPAHVAQMALTRIVGVASSSGAKSQAEKVRDALLSRLAQSGDNNDRARVVAAQLLGLIGSDDRRTARALKDAVLGGGRVAGAALEAAQRIPGGRITDALLDALPQVQPPGKVALILALGARKDRRALPALSRLAQQESGEVQVAALQALGVLGDPQAASVLQTVAQSGAEASRKAAVDALLLLADAPGLKASARAQILQAAQKLAVTEAQKEAARAALSKP